MSNVLAKFTVTEITESRNHYQGTTPITHTAADGKVVAQGGHGGGPTARRIKLAAVMGEPFGPATPQGSIEMLIVNGAAASQFHVGKDYFVTFKEDDGTGAD